MAEVGLSVCGCRRRRGSPCLIFWMRRSRFRAASGSGSIHGLCLCRFRFFPASLMARLIICVRVMSCCSAVGSIMRCLRVRPSEGGAMLSSLGMARMYFRVTENTGSLSKLILSTAGVTHWLQLRSDVPADFNLVAVDVERPTLSDIDAVTRHLPVTASCNHRRESSGL